MDHKLADPRNGHQSRDWPSGYLKGWSVAQDQLLRGPALPVLDQMMEDEKYHGYFDFVFVDAGKDNYLNYHKRIIELVKVSGLIGYDNTLWKGSMVAPPDAPLRKYVRYYRDFVLELNKVLAADPRIEICQLSVGDGITLCRRTK